MAAMSSDNGNVVFIDTNLDTHLALTVSDHDTVSDFKKRIVLEHPLCFPKIGQIQINGIKVKRNGHFYHLLDSMILKSAFNGYNRSWFLSVDVSTSEDCKQNEQLFSHASLHWVGADNALVRPNDNDAIISPCNYQLQMLKNKHNEREGVHVVSPCVSKQSARKADMNLKAGVNSSSHHDIEIPSPGSIPKRDDCGPLNNEVPSLHMECEVDGIDEGNKGDCNVYEDEPSISVQSEMRKQKKKRKREDNVEGDKSKEEIASDHPRVSVVTGKKAVKDVEMVPSLNIECKVGESGEGNKDDYNKSEDVPLITAPSANRRNKRRNNRKKEIKKKNEDAAGGDNSKEETPSDHPHVSEHTEKEAVKNLEVTPSLHMECEVYGSGEENKGVAPSTSVPGAKKKGGNNSEINIDPVGNPVGCPSERASSFNIFQVPQSESKQDEKEEIPIDRPCFSPLTGKKTVKILEVVPNSHIECGIDGSNKGCKDDSIVCEEGTSKPSPSAKKKKSKRKRKNEVVVGVDISNDNFASVDNPPGSPSERASNFISFQVPQSNNQEEKEEIPFDRLLVSQPTEKAVKNLEMVPNSHIECEVDGSNKVSKDDSIVCEEGTSKPALSSKKKKKSKSKRQKGDAVGGDISKDNIAFVDNPPDCPSERASNFNSFQVPQSNNKQDEKEEIPFDRPCVSQLTDKEAVQNLKMAPNSHIECEVDGSNKGSKDESIVCEDGTSKPAPSAKKKKANRRKKEETMPDDTLKENDASVVVPALQNIVVLANSSENANKDSVVLPAQQDIIVLANSSENANKEVTMETDLLKEHQNTACNDKNTKNDVNVLSTNEASELMSPAKKKQRKGKKLLAHESKDIIISDTNLDKMEIGTDACKESMQSATKEAGNYKNQNDIELEVQLSDANKPKDLMENNENVVIGHCNESEVGQIDGAAVGEVSPQNVDMNGIKEPVKPVKEKKRIKKALSKVGGETLRKDNGHVDASKSETVTKSLKATICDPMPGNTKTKENPLNKTEGKVLQQEKMQGTVPSVTDKRDDFSTENIDSPEQTKTKPNAPNVDEHVSKRLKNNSNNKQTSTPKGTSDMLTNVLVFDSKKERVVNRIDEAPNAQKSGKVAKLSSQSDSGMSSIGEYRKPPNSASGKSKDLEKQRKHIPTSKAKLEEGFNKMVQNKARKASGNDALRVVRNSQQKVVSNSQQKKSLLDGAIFKDDSDSASEDEDKAYNSDASTRTPSDNSIPSDLDGYDSPGLDSQQNGSYDGKGLENDERSSLKSSLSGTTKLPIEQILRSSARYKKAKITASQLDESETPPEFVPDSLA